MPGEACWPCRERKVKCNSMTAGVPCGRCRTDGKVDECFVPAKQKRKIKRTFKRPRTRRNVNTSDQLEPIDTYSNIDHVPAATPLVGSIHSARDVLTPTGQRIVTDAGDQDATRSSQRETSISDTNALSNGSTVLSDENEDDVLARVCQKISSGRADGFQTVNARMWTESIEYQNSFNATGILGEVLSRREASNRLIKINYDLSSGTAKGHSPKTRREVELLGLDDFDRTLLASKGVFELPPKSVCLEFFRIYFRYAFPYAPVIDQGEFLTVFDKGEHSSFLVQAILANVVPYCPKDLVQRAGFMDHASAQKTFYKRAVLLYDFNCEKSQLILLQGSLLLGTQWLSYFSDKDYQFWMCNAIRIAARMGIHRRHIESDLDPKFYKLLKRIWWTISIRDVLTTISGLDNGRPALPRQCDTEKLSEDDWSEEHACSAQLRAYLSPTQGYHKQFFIQLSGLSKIGAEAHDVILSRSPLELDQSCVSKVIDRIHTWKVALPSVLRAESVTDWSEHGLWILVLMAWCYRMECNLYRALRKANAVSNDTLPDYAPRLHNAIFELDIIVKRAVAHKVGKLLPMSFSTAVATLIALCIEMLLQADICAADKLMCEEAVRTGMAFLVDSQETWSCLRWMLRMFRWALSQSHLDYLAASSCEPSENLNQNQTNIVETAFEPGSAMSSQWPNSNDMLWESAFLSTSGFPDWQEWLDF